MKDYIIGTWWLIKTREGKRYLARASKVENTTCGVKHSGDKMKGWVGLDDNLRGRLITKEGDVVVARKDFEGINFPEMTDEYSPVEIEIGKSGRVYTYES